MHTHSKSYYEITNQEFTCAKWASIVGTIPIDAKTKAHLQKGNIVFEWDFEKYGCKNNPGVGPALGTVRELNRHTAMINWADENSMQIFEDMKYADIRLAPGLLDDNPDEPPPQAAASRIEIDEGDVTERFHERHFLSMG